MASGIYTITCIANGRVYVGSAVDFGSRRRLHLHNLRNGNHHSQKMQRSFNKYGESAFEFALVLECERDCLIAEEQKFINEIRPWFNSNPVAGSRLGSKATQETKERLRLSHLGKKPSAEAVKAQRAAMLEYAKNPEVRARLAVAALGRKQSQEEIQRRVMALKGKKRSEEDKQTMRTAQRIRWGLDINENLILTEYSLIKSVRGVSAALGYGRKAVRGVIVRAGLL